MFTIFLCFAIGLAFVEPQRVEISMDDLRGSEDDIGLLHLYVNDAVNFDQNLQSKDVQVPAQSGNSNETETNEKPKSPTKRARAIPHRGKDITIKTGQVFRRKRGQSYPLHRKRRSVSGVLHPKSRRKIHSKDKLSHKTSGKTKLKKTKEKEQEAKHHRVTLSSSSRTSDVSYSAMQYLLNKLPGVLRGRILITDAAEKVVLKNYVKSKSVAPETLYTYNSAMKDERELLKRLLADMPIILSTYKALRKGSAWNHTRLHRKFINFFGHHSHALTEYESLKGDEMASLDGFLAGSSHIGVPQSVESTNSSSENLHEAEIPPIKGGEKQITEEKEKANDAEK